MADAPTRIDCPVCGAGSPVKYDGKGQPLYKCPSCTLLFHDRAILESMEDLYGEGYFTGEFEGGVGYADYIKEGWWFSERVYGEIQPWLERHFPQKGRLLDVGCASGPFVKAAAEGGWTASGTDVSEFAVKAGREQGLDLHAGTLAEVAFDDASFDVVTSFHVVEHLPDPVDVLGEMRRVAKPSAGLVVEVPNVRSVGFLVRKAQWGQVKPPEHLNHFNRPAMDRLLSLTGWRPEKWQTTYLPEVAADAAGEGGLARVIGIADKVGAVKVLERIGLGANLRVYARAI